jgi:hypothetical protein
MNETLRSIFSTTKKGGGGLSIKIYFSVYRPTQVNNISDKEGKENVIVQTLAQILGKFLTSKSNNVRREYNRAERYSNQFYIDPKARETM